MRRVLAFLPVLMVVAACDAGSLVPPVTAVPPALSLPPLTSTTTMPPPPTTAVLPDITVDLGSARFVTASLEIGVRGRLVADNGTILAEWDNDFATFGGVANDGHGGIAWLQGLEVYWLPAGATAPQLVPADTEFAWTVSRAPLRDTPAIALDGQVISLPDGTPLDGDVDSTVMTAANGLTARIIQAEVTTFSEGFIDQILVPARLQVIDEATTLLDVPVGGGASEAFVTIEDFDGHTIILRRFPEEPAIPTDTHIMFDLSDSETVTVWREATSTTALVGISDASVPDVQAPDLTLVCPTWTGGATSDPQPGLSDFVNQTRSEFLAALQTCDFNYLGSIGTVVLGHAETPRDPSEWDREAFSLMAEVMRLPFAETDETYVWPKWLGVGSLAELSNADIDLMESLYDETPAEIIDSPFLVPVVRIEIGRFDGYVRSVLRPLS